MSVDLDKAPDPPPEAEVEEDHVVIKLTKPKQPKRRTARAWADRAKWITRWFLRGAWYGISHCLPLAWRETKYTWLGFSIVFGTWRNWVLMTKRTTVLDAEHAMAVKQGFTFDSRKFEKRDEEASRRVAITLVVGALIPLIALLTWWVPYTSSLSVLIQKIVLIVFLCICDGIGRTHRDPEMIDLRPRTPLEPGVSIRKLQASIKDILITGKQPVEITFHGQRWMDHGVELDCHTSDVVSDDHLRALERHLQAGFGMITLIRNRKNTAAPVLRLFWTDPLEGAVEPARRTPKSISCRDAFNMTRTDDAGRGFLFPMAHMLWVGRSGSGKSSGLWVFIDWLIDCYDADVYGIDTTTGPCFGAYRKLLAGFAFDGGAAHTILDDATSEAMRRNTLLNEGMDADEDGLLDENFQISGQAGQRAWFIIIDEYSTLAQDQDLRQKVERLLEIGRKARIFVVISTPSASKRSIVSTVPVNQTMVKVVFGVPFVEIQFILGPGSSDDGWRPDRFISASVNDPHDSGKAVISSGDHGSPVTHRFDRLTPEMIRDRNRDRRIWLQATADIPHVLRMVLDVFNDLGNPEFLPTATIISHDLATGWTSQELAAKLKQAPMNVEPTRGADPDGTRVRGYDRAAVQAAVQRCA